MRVVAKTVRPDIQADLNQRIALFNAKKMRGELDRYDAPGGIGFIQSGLPENVALVQYFMSLDKCTIMVVKPNDVRFIDVAVKKKKVEELVSELRTKVGGARQDISCVSSRLFNLFVEPLERGGFLDGADTLAIAPQDVLHYVPFGLLCSGDKRNLIERYRIFYVKPVMCN